MRIQRYNAAPLETRGYLASWGADDRLTLYASTQNPHPLRTQLAEMLGVPPTQIHVIATRMGGGFGHEITTIEGLGKRDDLSHLQEAFREHDGFQCGPCLPGQLFADDLLRHVDGVLDDAQIRHAMQSSLCRCIGYQKTIDAIRAVAENAKMQLDGRRSIAGSR